MRNRLNTLIIPLLCMLALPTLSANAQGVSFGGRVTLPDETTPAQGVVIEAERVGSTEGPVRALTSSTGNFLLNLPQAGSYILRGLRIGYQPTQFGTFEVTNNYRHPTPLVIGAVTLHISTIQVDTVGHCASIEGRSGALVASLLHQARTALATTVLSSSDGSAEATWLDYRIVTDREGTPLTPLRVTQRTGATERPYRSVDANTLANEGYVVDTGNEVIFRAPDADVLLSEQFIEGHCFRLNTMQRSDTSWVGVAFAPSGRVDSTMVGVFGTLWLDRDNAELKRLEFGYTGLNRELASGEAGGTVDFRRLPTGVWLVDQWKLKMPRVTYFRFERNRGSPEFVRVVNAVDIVGGQVESVRRAGQSLYNSEGDPAAALPEIVAKVDDSPVCTAQSTVAANRTGMLYGTVVDDNGNPVMGTTVRAVWSDASGIRIARGDLRATHHATATDGFFLFCGVPLGTRVQLTADMGTRSSRTTTLRLEPGTPHQSVEIRFGGR